MGNKIKERRQALNMSQEELAEKSAVSRATISNLENNPDSSVSIRTLEKLATALDSTVKDIFFSDSV